MGPITGYGRYNGGYGGRAYSSVNATGSGAESVKDYATAAAYLGAKHDRPLAYATRLQKVKRSGTYGERLTAGESQGYAVVHHGTPIVIWRRDGLTEFLAYNSVTTRARLNSYLPLSIYSERGRMAVYPSYRWEKDGTEYGGRAIYPRDWPMTARRIGKCRTCDGKGRHGADSCYGARGWYAQRQKDRCQCGRIGAHNGRYYYGEKSRQLAREAIAEGMAPRNTYAMSVPCESCKGLGHVDHGSKPIPFYLAHGETYLVAGSGDGARVAGSYGSARHWSMVPLPEKPRRPVREVKRPRVGEVLAYRAWQVEENGTLRPYGLAKLPAYDSFNLPAATCANDVGHTAPEEGCMCGYWSLKDPAEVPDDAPVYGAVRIWGRYAEHRIGYRSEHMAIDYLVAPRLAAAVRIAERYPDVPVYSAPWPLQGSPQEHMPIVPCACGITEHFGRPVVAHVADDCPVIVGIPAETAETAQDGAEEGR